MVQESLLPDNNTFPSYLNGSDIPGVICLEDMSDREFGGADDLSLPKATVQKIIQEILAQDGDGSLAFSRESRDLLIECCVEFVTLISSEANEIAEKDAKKTIACEHVTAALKQLGYTDYVPEILKVAQDHKQQQQSREKKTTKMEQSGLTEEELIAQQQALFQSANEKFNHTGE